MNRLMSQTETLFHSYSQYASIPQRLTPQPTEEERRLEEEIDDHLDKVSSYINIK